MRKALLDSDILSEISKGFNQTVLQHASDYLDEHARFTFTSINVYEVLYGIKAKPALKQAERFLSLLAEHEEIVPDAHDYRVAADIRAAMHLAGTEIGKADPVIAACAYRRGLPLVTGNTKHYQFVTNAGFGLDLENWRDPLGGVGNTQ
jgi:predicted nucleic acid-binding protein